MSQIILTKNEGGSFNVHCGERFEWQLSPDEALHTVASFIMGSKMRYLKTADEHVQWRTNVNKIQQDRASEVTMQAPPETVFHGEPKW